MFDRLNEGRWWDRAWSLVEGCTPCSPGCDHCWLQAMERRFRGGGGVRVRFRCDRLLVPLKRRVPTAWAVWSDLFHIDIYDFERFAVLAEAERNPQHIFLLLTKRADRMLQFGLSLSGWPPNVWAGVTVCNQAEADEKIPFLLQVPAAKRFVSYEPALGPVDLQYAAFNGADSLQAMAGIDWVIAGGESGPGARPAHPNWFRTVRDQCQLAGVPFFFKQWGEWGEVGDWRREKSLTRIKRHYWPLLRPPVSPYQEGVPRAYPRMESSWRIGKVKAGRTLDGREWNEIPFIPGRSSGDAA